MKFLIAEAESLKISGLDVSELLNEIYVDEDYVEDKAAVDLFEFNAVKKRGVLICALENHSSDLAGIVIVVPYDSPASQIANENESEMHLLGVKKNYRNNGLGDSLIKYAINSARSKGYHKMILWTQRNMEAAQKLYKSNGFIHIENITKNGREFLIYEKNLLNDNKL